MVEELKKPHWTRIGIGKFAFAFLNVALIGLLICHWFQFDGLVPVTMVPPWIWLVPSILVIALFARRVSRLALVTTLIVLIAFGILFVEEARSLLRFNKLSDNRANPGLIRVATLNCASSAKAALELGAYSPNIILFQESPSAAQLNDVGMELFGEQASLAHIGDTSILVRGELEYVLVDRSKHFVHCVAKLSDGFRVDVVSLRLSPPVFRMDFIDSGFWSDHRETRELHRNQLAEIVTYLKTNQVTKHLIIGGDFNMVGNDGGFGPFADLSDTFDHAGTGWCNTGTNEYPLFRVDQIWISDGMSCSALKVFQSKFSDHRMVVADIKLD